MLSCPGPRHTFYYYSCAVHDILMNDSSGGRAELMWFGNCVRAQDYIYVITWLPAATVLYHKWFEGRGFCRFCCCAAPEPDEPKKVCCGCPASPVVAAAVGVGTALPFSPGSNR